MSQQYQKQKKKWKQEALDEFAERLKEEIHFNFLGSEDYRLQKLVDKILKEMKQ